MKGHLYKVDIQRIRDNKGNDLNEPAVTFETRNHDDIMRIIDAIKGKALFEDESDAMSFAVGLKLFSEVMLTNKDHPVFEPLRPAFNDFMNNLKKS